MDKEMEEELKDMRLGFEKIQSNGKLSNVDIEETMKKIKTSLFEIKSGQELPMETGLSMLREKYVTKEVY